MTTVMAQAPQELR